MAKISKRTGNSNNDGVSMKFNVPMLNMIVKYVMSAIPGKPQLTSLYKLISFLDMDSYNYMPEIQQRLNLILHVSDAKINLKMKETDLIRSYVLSKDNDLETLCSEVSWADDQLEPSECRYISENISDRLQYIYLFQVKDTILEMFNQIDRAEFFSYYEIVTNMKKVLSETMTKLQSTVIGNGLIKSFNFSDVEVFEQLMDVIVEKAKRPSAILQTGIRQLNAILSPGFQAGRLYCFLGPTGRFKSGTLLNVADQIRLFNPQIKPVEDGKRKTILFVTMENMIEESIIRLFDMYNEPSGDIQEYTTEEVIRVIREQGHYTFTATDGIDIEFRYFNNLEINTGDLYPIIQDLEDNGKHVIALVLDYIKRIDAVTEYRGDEHVRTANAAKELKNLAINLDIPVITAQQVNRGGNSIIDAAMREDKHDVAKFIGMSDTGSAWALMEECDFVCVINLEKHRATGKTYLTMKRVKLRGKKDLLSAEYFNHPFVNDNGIRLETDVDKEMSVSKLSLATDLESLSDDAADKIERKLLYPKVQKDANGKRVNNVLQAVHLDDKSSSFDPLTLTAV